MKAVEFESQLGPDNTLAVPEAIATQLPPGKRVRVLVLVEELSEDQEWQQMTAQAFLKGYAESDAIYDRVATD